MLCQKLMFANSSPVTSIQQGCHEQLERVVLRHLGATWRRPLAEHNRAAFRRAEAWLACQQTGAPILDSGCGTGRSSLRLARMYPDHPVIGIDQSAKRLAVLANAAEPLPDNLLLLRAECADFWRLIAEADWPLARHFLLYPNPWPKPGHLQRRWHGHPVFGHLMTLPGTLELRSNWLIYIEEFASACGLAGRHAAVDRVPGQAPALSDFEEKYRCSGHALHRLLLQPAEMSTG